MKSGEQQDGRDSRVVGAYRAASDALDERPSAAARAAILAAAARAVDAQPRDAQTGATARRAANPATPGAGGLALSRRPLALAASFLVATVALVLATNVEREPHEAGLRASAPAPTADTAAGRKANADSIAGRMADTDGGAGAGPESTNRAPMRADEQTSAKRASSPQTNESTAAIAEQDAPRRLDAPRTQTVVPSPEVQVPQVPALAAPKAEAPRPSVSQSAPEVKARAPQAAVQTPEALAKVKPREEQRAPATDALALSAPPLGAREAERKLSERRNVEKPALGAATVPNAAPLALADKSTADGVPPQARAPASPAAALEAPLPPRTITAITPEGLSQGAGAAAAPAPPSTPGLSGSATAGTLGRLATNRVPSEPEARRLKEDAALRASKSGYPSTEPAQDARGQGAPAPARATPPAASASEPAETRSRQLMAARPVDRTTALERDVENDPARWIQRIVTLRDAGLDADADRELARLRERYPEMQIPPNALRRAGTR